MFSGLCGMRHPDVGCESMWLFAHTHFPSAVIVGQQRGKTMEETYSSLILTIAIVPLVVGLTISWMCGCWFFLDWWRMISVWMRSTDDSPLKYRSIKTEIMTIVRLQVTEVVLLEAQIVTVQQGRCRKNQNITHMSVEEEARRHGFILNMTFFLFTLFLYQPVWFHVPACSDYDLLWVTHQK